jgi:hypothetical protein
MKMQMTTQAPLAHHRGRLAELDAHLVGLQEGESAPAATAERDRLARMVREAEELEAAREREREKAHAAAVAKMEKQVAPFAKRAADAYRALDAAAAKFEAAYQAFNALRAEHGGITSEAYATTGAHVPHVESLAGADIGRAQRCASAAAILSSGRL